MTTKWTKGPWRVFRTTDGKKILGVGDAEGGGVASLWLDGPEQSANARLIAAAPKMADYVKRKADDGCEEAARIWGQINAR